MPRPASTRRDLAETGPARTAAENQLLAKLPGSVRQRLGPHLQRVTLKAGQTIFQANQGLQAAYFPETAVISLVARLVDGQTLEVGLVGRDGMAGVALIPGVNMMPYDGIVQVGGAAQRMRAELLRDFVREVSPFHQLLGRYAYTVFAHGVQTAVCNSFHPIKKRCARWLLMLHDLSDGDTFPVTQNLLAVMLGVRRPSVTLAAHALMQDGFVEYRHGHMHVRNRRGLEAEACECYRFVRDERQRLLGY